MKMPPAVPAGTEGIRKKKTSGQSADQRSRCHQACGVKKLDVDHTGGTFVSRRK